MGLGGLDLKSGWWGVVVVVVGKLTTGSTQTCSRGQIVLFSTTPQAFHPFRCPKTKPLTVAGAEAHPGRLFEYLT